MLIGINATAAFIKPRTGVEEYCYQVIKHLTMLPEAREHRFLLYLPSVALENKKKLFDFPLPENFIIKQSKWPIRFFWTQIRLAWDMLIAPPESSFFPVQIMPFFYSRNSTVAIHGLEFEYLPDYYHLWQRLYFRWNAKFAVQRARKIIAVSENTKNDLIKLYGAKESGIEVVYHGISLKARTSKIEHQNLSPDNPYLLYIGRVELKKNIMGILQAYKILKEKYKIPHELVLAGAPGFGYDKIQSVIRDSKYKIHQPGYVSADRKQQLLANADAFIFPSFYEGFGMPILEAQSAGVPVVSSNISSVPEVAGDSAILVDPNIPEQIAEAVYKIIDDKNLRDRLIELGFANVKKFSWEKCAKETLKVIIES